MRNVLPVLRKNAKGTPFWIFSSANRHVIVSSNIVAKEIDTEYVIESQLTRIQHITNEHDVDVATERRFLDELYEQHDVIRINYGLLSKYDTYNLIGKTFHKIYIMVVT